MHVHVYINVHTIACANSPISRRHERGIKTGRTWGRTGHKNEVVPPEKHLYTTQGGMMSPL